MADKYEEMAQQMRADGVDEAMIARFVAKEMQEDEFRRGRGMTDIEAARAWKRMPENIQQLLLGQRLLPQLRHGVVCKRLLAAHARRLRAHRGQVRRMRCRDRQALRLGQELFRQNQGPHLQGNRTLHFPSQRNRQVDFSGTPRFWQRHRTSGGTAFCRTHRPALPRRMSSLSRKTVLPLSETVLYGNRYAESL